VKTAKIIAEFSVVFLVAFSVSAQGFINLNFEAATLSPTAGPQNWPNLVPISQGLPGWTAYLGSVQQSGVGQNTYANSVATVDILGPGFGTQPGPYGNFGVIDRNYTALLQGGITPDSPQADYVSASIAQVGTIPATAQSLQFDADPSGGSFSVSFAGNTLTPELLSIDTTPSGLVYGLFGVNVAPYANQTGQLEFSTTDYSSLLLDDITFSTTPVPTPEPNILGLTAIGGLVFCARKWLAR